MLDAENWKFVIKVWTSNFGATLAYQLIAIKKSLQRGRKGIPNAITGLDVAIDSLFPHTDFYEVSHQLYLRRLNRTLKPWARRNTSSAWNKGVTSQ